MKCLWYVSPNVLVGRHYMAISICISNVCRNLEFKLRENWTNLRQNVLRKTKKNHVHVPSKESDHTESQVKWETSHAKWDKIVKVRAALERYSMPFLMKIVPNQPTELLQMFPIHSLFDFYRQFTEDLKITNQAHDEQKQALGNHRDLEFYLYPKATITVWKKYCSIWFTKFYWVVITSEGRVGLKTPKLDASSSTVWKL